MSKPNDFGEQSIGVLHEAVAHAHDDSVAWTDRVELTARKTSVAPPPHYGPDQIRALRHGMGVSQPVFAGLLNVSNSTVRAWEQGQRSPDGPSLRLLEVAQRNPDALMSNVTAGVRFKRGTRRIQ
jgi:putative transcriptional regulator